MNDLCCCLKIQDPEKGTLYVSVDSFYPLNTSDLLKKDTKNFDVKIRVKKSILNGIESTDKNETRSLPITFNSNLKVFSLVNDGWLPPPFSVPSVFLLDRNIVSAFEKNQSRITHYEENCWWFDLYNGSGKSCLEVNVIFAAIEGDLKKLPEFDIFLANIEKYNKVVNRQFVSVKNSHLNLSQLKTVYDVIVNKNYTKNIAFLQATTPLILKSVPYKNKRKIFNDILVIAKEHGINVHSHLLILVIACLYESPSSNYKFARKILKPKATYTKEIAHNCVFDVLFIDLLLILKFFINPNYSGVSADIALSVYWTIVKPKINFENTEFNFNLQLSKTLFEGAIESDLDYIVTELSKL